MKRLEFQAMLDVMLSNEDNDEDTLVFTPELDEHLRVMEARVKAHKANKPVKRKEPKYKYLTRTMLKRGTQNNSISQWEKEFLQSIHHQDYIPTAKQRAILERISRSIVAKE